jgi:NAD(P)-dependent dehydrogenase (short-subunit alcohol dehydrogenase family)
MRIAQQLRIKYLSELFVQLPVKFNNLTMNIIVNGGTRGIGIEVVHYLALNSDFRIMVTGRNEQVLDSLKAQYPNVITAKTDLSVFDAHANSFVDEVKINFNQVDILINVAGLLISNDFSDSENSDARLMMETNFFGPASVIRLLKPLMTKGSHIVNISSMGGFQGSSKYRGLSYYSASKAALASLSECLAMEFQPDGIKVNCLALGAVQTEMLEEAFPGYKAPVSAKEMGEFIAEFALNGHKVFNGKILPVAVTNP